jgi:hypothetical protein
MVWSVLASSPVMKAQALIGDGGDGEHGGAVANCIITVT